MAGKFGDIFLRDMAATEALARQIAGGLRAGDSVALEGDLGAGKTALARAVLQALGVTEDVPSPTFTLVQRYETPGLVVNHFDLYRIKQESELDELGFDDALAEGVALIEWPERAAGRIPDDALHIHLVITGDGARHATLSGPPRWMEILSGAAHV